MYVCIVFSRWSTYYITLQAAIIPTVLVSSDFRMDGVLESIFGSDWNKLAWPGPAWPCLALPGLGGGKGKGKGKGKGAVFGRAARRRVCVIGNK